ncbi:MAG: hypothetical protein IIA87_03130 [Nanoarchaeota archaeon]|nr:hypothetical protein [Nanoarchaeota archaeon]
MDYVKDSGERILEHKRIAYNCNSLCRKFLSGGIFLHPNLKNANNCILDGTQKLKVFDESEQKTQRLFDVRTNFYLKRFKNRFP